MTAKEIRKKFINFFVMEKHLFIPSFSLVPENDPTLLLVNSGMVPMKPYFLGLEEPPSKRIVDIQKCIRMEDVEKVGVSVGTLTFFEMMGNWSFGDYGKEEALMFAWNLLVKDFGFEPTKLWATVFVGAKNLPSDTEAIKIWNKFGIPEKKIIKLGMDDNFWVSGPTGPCGPCTEVFYDLGEEKGPVMIGDTYNRERLLEIWNACVFIQYNRDDKGNYHNLPFCSIDAGAGVERFSMVLQKKETVFETELFRPIIQKVEEISGKKYEENLKEFRIIADHLRAATFLISDGVIPSNVERGYVLRRLIRRAVFKMMQIPVVGSKIEASKKICQTIVNTYSDNYPNLGKFLDIGITIGEEIEKFERTLNKGVKFLKKFKQFDGKIAFDVFQTYGVPLDVTKEIATQRGQKIKEKDFEKEFEKHQDISRAGAKKKFVGGLADHSETVTKYHTATHILQAVLRKVLGDHVCQVGSNLTAERLRFDFTHPEKLSTEQLTQVENLVNQKISQNLPVKMEMMSLEEAKKQGALAFFEQKYGEKVKVYRIGDFSKEICGGPHVQNAGEIGRIEIFKEESCGAGKRRLYARIVKK